MKFRAAFSILATTAGIWAASGPACEPNKDAFAPEGVADQITLVTPESSTRAAGDTMTFVALVSDEGLLRRNVQTVWTYTDMNGNVVSRDTVMTDNEGRTTVKYTIGNTPGDYRVSLKVIENMSLNATWTVRVDQPAPPTVAKVVLSKDTLRLPVETSSKLTGQVFDASNNPLTATLNWSTMNSNVASVAADGTVTGRATGTTRVIANSGAFADTAVVIVEPPAAVTTITIQAQNPMMLRRLANGGTESHSGNMYVGDHELNGDKTMQGFVMYNLSNVPTSATITSATIAVSTQSTSFQGNPFALGPLFVERATPGPTLNEGTPNGVQVMTAAQSNVVINIKPLIDAARSAGETVIWLRLRMRDMGNNNNAVDYGEFTVSAAEIKY